MSIDNIIQMNDWEIGKFLKFVFSIQIVVLGILGLVQIGIEIPFMKEIFGFIYLTFIPGIIILRILKIHNLYSVGSFNNKHNYDSIVFCEFHNR